MNVKVEANYDEVICPNCVLQFRAIPVNVQTELVDLRAEIERLQAANSDLQAWYDAAQADAKRFEWPLPILYGDDDITANVRTIALSMEMVRGLNSRSKASKLPEASEPKCKTHLDAPHGYSRAASHMLGRYVCECEHWEPE